MRNPLSECTVGGMFGKPIMVLLIFIVCFLASHSFSEQVLLPSEFTLTIDSRDVVVKLPNELPSMEAAEYAYEDCFNLILCRQRYCLSGDVPGHELHDHVDFIYTNKAEVIALVWIKTFERVYVAWKYVDGVPILVDINTINELIRHIEKPKELSFILLDKYPSEPLFGPVRVDFTWEGELDPDVFGDWSVIKVQPDSRRGIIWTFWRNPDADSPIKVVVGELYFDGSLIMYRYFKYGVPYMFYLDSEKNRYTQHNFTDEEKSNCMKCHRDKVEPPAVLDEIRLNRVVFG